MKTVKLKSGKVKRMNDCQALVEVQAGHVEFCPKWMWKKQEKLGPWKERANEK